MVEKIAGVLNKVSTTFMTDKFATPLRIQRDLVYGALVIPPELDKGGNTASVPKLPPIDWKTAMGLQ